MNIYGIYDKKAQVFDFIYTSSNDDTAVRPVFEILSKGASNYLNFPDDYAVYKLGSFNIRTGSIYTKDMKVIVFEVRSLFNLAKASEGVEDSSETEATPSVSEDVDKSVESEDNNGI